MRRCCTTRCSLEIDQGSGAELWTRVDDFFGSSPTDRHYVLDRTTGEIRFGDGRNGSIPVANAANPEGEYRRPRISLRWRQTGQCCRPGAIKTLTTSIDGIDDNQVAQSARRRTAAVMKRRWTKRRNARRARSRAAAAP